jgi:hypothetical protein
VRFLNAKLAARPCSASGTDYQNRSAQRLLGGALAGRGAACLLSLILGAVIFAQMLGLTHGLAHESHESHESHKLHKQHAASAELQHHHHEVAGDYKTSGLKALFASHDDGSDSCRIFDQHGYSAPISAVAALALPSVLRAALQPKRTGCDLSGTAAPFKARAPPSSR